MFQGGTLYMDRIVMINSSNSNITTRKATLGAELDLVSNFIDYKTTRFKRKKNDDVHLAVFCEPQINNAFPDIIFAEYNIRHFKNWNQFRNMLDNQDLKILYHLYYTKGLESSSIVKQLGITYAVLLKSIEKLMDANLIKRNNGLWCIKEIDSFFAVTKIESVEAKLNQWNSALKQALQNTRYSSESYVLSELKTKPTQHTVEIFNGYGIGMYLKNQSGFNKVNIAKHSSIPNSYTSVWIGELIGRTLNS